MLTFILATIIASAAAGNTKPREYYEKLFFDHIQQFKLQLKDGADFKYRLDIFAGNIDIIEAHNADSTRTYSLGSNQFSHLTFDEFLDTVHIGGTRPPFLRKQSTDIHSEPKNLATLPTSVDWVAAGAVTPVKYQGNCGSCWSFSTTGSLEGAYFIKYHELQSFSEQELVSCDHTGSNAGCNGGWMDDAFTFVKRNGGLTTETSYPYTSGTTGKSGTCTRTGYTDNTKVAPTGYTDVQAGSVNALMSAVAQQPVSIAIQANEPAFQFYSSGIITGSCGQQLDHGVLVVGYGTDNGVDFWKVKNSWGSAWGENGYVRIERSSDNLCGVLNAASYPNL